MSEPTTFAKVENNVVTQVSVVEWDFLVAHTDIFGDSSLWIECFLNNTGRGYCGIGWLYDAVNDVFVAPTVPEESE